jgi:hypothetical protein
LENVVDGEDSARLQRSVGLSIDGLLVGDVHGGDRHRRIEAVVVEWQCAGVTNSERRSIVESCPAGQLGRRSAERWRQVDAGDRAAAFVIRPDDDEVLLHVMTTEDHWLRSWLE